MDAQPGQDSNDQPADPVDETTQQQGAAPDGGPVEVCRMLAAFANALLGRPASRM